MHVTASKVSLAPGLGIVSGAADTKNIIPMLGTILLKASKGKLSMLCSDSGMIARSLADCDISTEGEVAVDVRRFTDLVRAVPDDGRLDMSIDDAGQLVVKAGRSRFRLPTLPAADYPRMTAEKAERVSVTIDATRLARMLEIAAGAMATADVRPALNGALLSLQDGALWLIGTDGFRLNIEREAIPGSESMAPIQVILPRKTVMLARKLLAQGGEVNLTFGKTDAQFAFNDGTVIMGKGIDAAYPDWKRIIPASPNHSILDGAKFRAALAMIDATVVADSQSNGVRPVDLEFGDGLLTLSSDEEARSEVEANNSATGTTTLSLDFLRDAIHAMAGTAAKIKMSFGAANEVVVVRNAETSDFPLALVMPRRK